MRIYPTMGLVFSMAKVREVNGCTNDSVEWGSLCKLHRP
jgi:hypothetical protein